MMPKPPFLETSPTLEQPADLAKSQAYAELYCISNFTFLRGASFPEELIEQASILGYKALAITDECSLSGVVRAHTAAKEKGVTLIIGSEFNLKEGCHFVLLAANRRGYGHLSHLISCARRDTDKGAGADAMPTRRRRPCRCALTLNGSHTGEASSHTQEHSRALLAARAPPSRAHTARPHPLRTRARSADDHGIVDSPDAQA